MALGKSVTPSGPGASSTSNTGPSPVRACSSRRAHAADVVGPEDGVDKWRPLQQELTVLLGKTAPDGDLHPGPLLPERLQVAQVAVELVVGVLAYAAGVEHDHVGLVKVLGAVHAPGREHGRDPLGVVLVHLAPEGADKEPANLRHERRLGGARPPVPARLGRPGPDAAGSPGSSSRTIGPGGQCWPGRRILDQDELIALLRAHRSELSGPALGAGGAGARPRGADAVRKARR